ncbi:MAG TPA: hypothetical protein VMA75_02415 [Candidatus Paceibacterota bacterium]|nr:hypothetical protein [Candidatus Paceibacterota bacterium]
MSKTGKILSGVVIAIIVIGGVWWWIDAQNGTVPTALAPGANGTSSVANSPAAASTSYPQGDSDQAIDQDMTSLNAQMNGLSSDNASVTQSMNDQPVQQAE